MNNGPENTQIEREAGDELDLLPLEGALRETLRHRDPPAGFADRVLALAQAGREPTPLTAPAARPAEGGKLLHWPDRRLWISGLIAAALVAGVLEGEIAVRRMREEQRRIVEATMQFQTTERITIHALAQAREQLQKAGVPLNLD